MLTGAASDYWSKHSVSLVGHAGAAPLPNPSPWLDITSEGMEALEQTNRAAAARLHTGARSPHSTNNNGGGGGGGVAATVPLYTRRWPMSWAAVVGDGATVVATMAGEPQRAVWFWYERGAALVPPHGASPAFRIALPMYHFAHGEAPRCDEGATPMPGCEAPPPLAAGVAAARGASDAAIRPHAATAMRAAPATTTTPPPLSAAGRVLLDTSIQFAAAPAHMRAAWELGAQPLLHRWHAAARLAGVRAMEWTFCFVDWVQGRTVTYRCSSSR